MISTATQTRISAMPQAGIFRFGFPAGAVTGAGGCGASPEQAYHKDS